MLSYPDAYRSGYSHAGTNCDAELGAGFRACGAKTRLAHRSTRYGSLPIEKADLIGFPGGFSYGDDVASGRIFAMHTDSGSWTARGAIDRGRASSASVTAFRCSSRLAPARR